MLKQLEAGDSAQTAAKTKLIGLFGALTQVQKRPDCSVDLFRLAGFGARHSDFSFTHGPEMPSEFFFVLFFLDLCFFSALHLSLFVTFIGSQLLEEQGRPIFLY